MNTLLVSLYETIAKYFAIGLDFESKININSSQRKLYSETISNKFESREYQLWTQLISDINTYLPNFKCISSSQTPGLLGQDLLENMILGDIIFQRYINLELSILGPYYTFHITNFLSLDSGEKSLPLTLFTKFGKDEELFGKIIETFKTYFPDFIFVPFKFLNYAITGLDVDGLKQDGSGKVYHGIFNNFDKILKGKIID